MASVADIRTFIYDTTYDSWNRMRNMTYHYNAAGQIVRLSGNKQGRESVIVDRIGYDKDGHTVYTKLGNGTETTYTYDKQRERLQAMNLTADGRAVMENKYQYDAVDNILGIVNAVDPTQAASNNNNSNNNNSNNNSNSGKAKLGGAFNHTYAYDDLNPLIKANGIAKGAKYEMTMAFGRMSEPLTKVQKVDSTKTAQSYDFTYKYEDSNHPTAPTQIGHEHYTYDANGNPTLVENDSLNTERRMYWDEDNRLMVLSDNGKTSRYTYNAAGERIVKSHGDLEGVYVNGAPQGMTFHETEDYTIYPAPIITVTKNRFTKHYFIGDKRVASKLGVGKFSNVYGISSNNVTAGQKDYAARMMQIEKQREEYYKSLGTPPGVPTMKGATADPDNTGYGYNTIIGELGDHSVPDGWVQRPKFNKKGDVPGPPIQWQKPEDPDNAQPGYGYVPADTTNTEDIFFYHSDHLGSTSYITDAKANITQFDAYLPYGELLVDEHSSSEEMPYKFNGKEFDQETGLYYYGARYMNPITGLWYGVDPLAEKYTSLSAYSYCSSNPINLIDPIGLGWVGSKGEDGTISWTWDDNVKSMNEAKQAGYFDYLEPGSIINNGTINGHVGEDGKTSVYLGYNKNDGSFTWPNSKVTPFEVGTEWLTGEGPRHRDFTNGDLFTEMLRTHEHVRNTIDNIKNLILSGSSLREGSSNYTLSGLGGVLKYMKDYSTLLTGGLTGNLAVTYLGSYTLNWRITNITKESFSISFMVNNTSTIQSGTRPPVIGYTDFWQKNIGRPLNKAFESGPMSKTSQTFKWTEKVKL